MDPLLSTNYPMRDMSYLIWDTLFAMDANFEVKPQMLDTFTICADGTTYDFALRNGLLFHDGAPVTSADVIASIDRWMGKDCLDQELAKRLDKIEATGTTSFRIVLKEPFAQPLNGLGRMTAIRCSSCRSALPRPRSAKAAGIDRLWSVQTG